MIKKLHRYKKTNYKILLNMLILCFMSLFNDLYIFLFIYSSNYFKKRIKRFIFTLFNNLTGYIYLKSSFHGLRYLLSYFRKICHFLNCFHQHYSYLAIFYQLNLVLLLMQLQFLHFLQLFQLYPLHLLFRFRALVALWVKMVSYNCQGLQKESNNLEHIHQLLQSQFQVRFL